jgi:hypothetical protein
MAPQSKAKRSEAAKKGRRRGNATRRAKLEKAVALVLEVDRLHRFADQ